MPRRNFALIPQIENAFEGAGKWNTRKDLRFSSIAAFLQTQVLLMQNMLNATQSKGSTEAGGLRLAFNKDTLDISSAYKDEHIESILTWCFRFTVTASIYYSALKACMDNSRLSREEIIKVLSNEYDFYKEPQGYTWKDDPTKEDKMSLNAGDLDYADTLSEQGIKACDLILSKLSQGHSYNALPVITVAIRHISMLLRDLKTVRSRTLPKGTRNKFLNRRLTSAQHDVERDIQKGRIVLGDKTTDQQRRDYIEREAIKRRVSGRYGHRRRGDVVGIPKEK